MDFGKWIREYASTVMGPRDDTSAVLDDLANLAAHQHEANVAAEALVDHEGECDKCWNDGMADCAERQELRGVASTTRVFALAEAEQFQEKYSHS